MRKCRQGRGDAPPPTYSFYQEKLPIWQLLLIPAVGKSPPLLVHTLLVLARTQLSVQETIPSVGIVGLPDCAAAVGAIQQ